MSENNKLISMSSYLTQDNTKQYLQKMLGSRTNQFITTLATMVGSNPALNECNRASLMGSALKAASMNLPIDQNLGFAYVIPYKNKGVAQASFQIGYKGLIQLAQRSGQVISINAVEVKEGEFKGRDMLGEPVIEWLPEEERVDKKTIGYMAGLRLVNGFTKIIYWTIADIEKHANKYSQAYRYAKKTGQSDAIWIEGFDSMAKKTLLKALIGKYCPMTTEMQEAIKSDQAVILANPDTEQETIIYADNVTDDIEKPKKISKQQILKIAKLVGDDASKLAVLNAHGYSVINEIEEKDYEIILSELKGE